MSPQYTPYALLSLASAFALAALAVLAWRRREAPGARAFAALMLAGCWWKLAYALGLASAGPGAKLLWAKAEYLGVAFVPLAWLALALAYAGVGERRRVLALLAIVPLATLALVWTNGAHGEPHGLVWASAGPERSGPFAPLEFAYGPWYWVHVSYSYALVLAGTLALIAGVARSSRPLRPQGLALLAGALLSWGANALYLLGFEPVPGLNPSVLVFPLTGALFALGLFRFGLLDLSPVARDAAFEASRDGLVVADPKGRVVDLNPEAERILGGPARRLLGASVSRLVPVRFPPLDAAHSVGEADRQEVELGDRREGVPGRYDLAQAPLEDSGGRRVGRLLSLRDVTERRRAEEAMRESEERFRSLVQNASDVITLLDPDGTVRYMSPAAGRVTGHPPEDLIGRDVFDHVHPDDRQRVRGRFAEGVADPGSRPTAEYRFRRKDGSWRRLESLAANLLDDPAVCAIVVNTRDVTERREAEEALREAEERYRTLVEGVPAITYVSLQRPGGRSEISYVSPQVERVLGYPPGEYAGDPSFWEGALHPDDRARVLAEDERTGETGGPFREEYRVVAKEGSVAWLREEGTLVRTEPDGTQVWHGVMFDVTELKGLEGELAHQALHDPLTGLPNRRLLVDRLGQALRRAERRRDLVAVLFVDLDNFKYVNDSLGHDAGDRLLVSAAERLRGVLRPPDTAARLGGDEFVALLEDVGGEAEAVRVAERIAEALGAPFDLGAPFEVGGQEAFVTASIGVALGGSGTAASGNPGHEGAADLLRRADLAMYEAKGGGKARHAVFDPESERRAVRRLGLENGLRRALERGEFAVLYQPVVLLETGRIVGFEALVRWERPGIGLVAPEEFVPLAEETGLIVPIGRWVLGEACRQAKRWQERHPKDPPLIVGANLSARQLSHPGLVEEVRAVLEGTGLAPDTLTLEVTESTLVGDAEAVLGALREIRGLGARFALDDFGTGYSSLSYLARLPAGLLKIDGSFVGRLGKEGAEGDAVLLSGVVGIAHGLGLRVCAEGVETEEQLGRLRAMGCDLAQGFLFSEPLTAEAATGLLAEDPRWP